MTEINKIAFMQGNEAVAHGAIAAGCRFYGGYPITPSTEVAEVMAYELPKVGGRFIQMEDEIAGMATVIGAAIAGAKTITATSGPGFSLKQENIGLAYIAEVPVVIVDVMRGGPSTGLPTKASQQDVMQARWGTHGDCRPIAYVPSSVQECYDLTIEAFNMAERFRQPVFVMSDQIVGHMREKVTLYKPEHLIERTKPSVPPEEYKAFLADPKTLIPEMAAFGDGYRWHVTGLTHDDAGFPTNDPKTIEKKILRLMSKIDRCRDEIVKFETESMENAKVVVLAYGCVARCALRAVRDAREAGMKVGFFRPKTIWPFPDKELEAMIGQGITILVPEMNCGQMVHEVERAVHGKAKVVSQVLVNGELYKPSDIFARIKEVC